MKKVKYNEWQIQGWVDSSVSNEYTRKIMHMLASSFGRNRWILRGIDTTVVAVIACLDNNASPKDKPHEF